MSTEPLPPLGIKLLDLEETPKPFRLETDAAWWTYVEETVQEGELRLIDRFVLSLDGHTLGRRLLFRGRFRGAVEVVCGRCAEPVELRFDEPLELLLEPAPDPLNQETSIELDPEESGVGRYAGDQLDFQPVLDEALWLAWPMQPLCREDCRGLCPGCGVNRNHESCECDTGERQGPFAGLAAKLAERAAGAKADSDDP